jgi:hypothetical protein
LESLARTLQQLRESKAIPPERFDSIRSRFHIRDSARTEWTVGLRNMTWHRLEQGKWIAGNPPAQLLVEESLYRELEYLAGREKPRPTCPGCGTPWTAGQKFCAHCGAPGQEAAVAAAVLAACPKCGKAVAGDKSFCTACGTKVR